MGLGFTPWLLYMIPLALTYWASYLYAPLMVAALCTILVFVGFTISPPLVPESIALTNRAIGAITFWTLGFLIAGYKVLALRLSHLTEQLKGELMERTQDLGRAVSALGTVMEGSRGAPGRPEGEEEFKIQVTEVLAAESRRLQEQVENLEQENQPTQAGEDGLEQTRSELERLAKQLEKVQRDLLHP